MNALLLRKIELRFRSITLNLRSTIIVLTIENIFFLRSEVQFDTCINPCVHDCRLPGLIRFNPLLTDEIPTKCFTR